MKNVTKKSIVFTAAVLVILWAGGCEVGINPLVIDGSAIGDSVRIDIDPPVPPIVMASSAVDLENVLDDLGDADSIRFYNLTLQTSNTTTDPSTRVSGSLRIRKQGSVQQDTLVELTNVLLTEFLSERSIFDKTISGFRFSPKGVATLVSALRSPRPLPMVTIYVDAVADQASLHFTMKLKVYAQVYTMP